MIGVSRAGDGEEQDGKRVRSRSIWYVEEYGTEMEPGVYAKGFEVDDRKSGE